MLPYISLSDHHSSPILRVMGSPLRHILTPLAGNSGNEIGHKYLCFLPVGNFYLLSRYHAAKYIKKPWLLSKVTPGVVDDLRNNKCLLILDLSNEGAAANELFSDVYDWIDDHRIPEKNIIFINQNRMLASSHERYFSNRRKISILYYDYFIKDLANHLANDEFVNDAGYSYDRVLEAIDAPKDTVFTCLNATIRPHRVAFAALLKNIGVLPDTFFSFHGAASNKQGMQSQEQVVQFLKNVGWYERLKDDAEEFLRSDPILIDMLGKWGNELANSICIPAYRKSKYSLVTETEFSSGEMHRVTEKTVKSFCVGHPAIIFGNPYSLRLMRDFGFQTFDPFINEYYDSIESQECRFNEIAKEMIRLRNQLQSRPLSKPAELREVCVYNAKHGYSEFRLAYENSVEQTLAEELEKEFARLPFQSFG